MTILKGLMVMVPKADKYKWVEELVPVTEGEAKEGWTRRMMICIPSGFLLTCVLLSCHLP